MATKYGTYSSDRLEDVPSNKVPPIGQHGVVRIAYDKYVLSGDLAAADIIHLGFIPQGARVVGYWLKTDDLDASGGTIDLGWAASADGVETADADGFLAAVDVTTSGGISSNHTSQANMAGLGKLFSAQVAVTATILGDTDATTGDIEVCIQYVID